MSSKRLLRQSLESIAHQADPRFFRELVDAFTELRADDYILTGGRNAQSALDRVGVPKLVYKHTGLTIDLYIGRDVGSPGVYPPSLDRNHPLVQETNRKLTSTDGPKIILRSLAKLKQQAVGSIDLKTGKVGGLYSQIKSLVVMPTLVVNSELFSVEETVAFFLHELGHLITYYEYLGRSVMLTHVLGDLASTYAETDSPKQRVELLEVTAEALDLHDLDAQRAATVSGKEAFQTLVVSEVIASPVSGADTQAYDNRTWEALADQYVVRHGAGRHLATGLDRLFRLSGNKVYRTQHEHLMAQALGTLYAIVPYFTPFFILALVTDLGDPTQSVYDPPEARMRRLRNDLVQAMKNPKLDAKFRKRLQEDADKIADLLKNMRDRNSFYRSVWLILRPEKRRQMKRIDIMQQLETLANNELFVKANQLTVQSEGETHA